MSINNLSGNKRSFDTMMNENYSSFENSSYVSSVSDEEQEQDDLHSVSIRDEDSDWSNDSRRITPTFEEWQMLHSKDENEYHIEEADAIRFFNEYYQDSPPSSPRRGLTLEDLTTDIQEMQIDAKYDVSKSTVSEEVWEEHYTLNIPGMYPVQCVKSSNNPLTRMTTTWEINPCNEFEYHGIKYKI